MDDGVALQGSRGFGIFAIIAGMILMGVAGACLTVTDPPFCLVLTIGGAIILGAGIRAVRRTSPPPSRRSSLILFVVGIFVSLAAIPLWK